MKPLKSEAEIVADACRIYGIPEYDRYGSSDWDWVHRLALTPTDELRTTQGRSLKGGDLVDFTGSPQVFAAILHAREALTVRRMALIQASGFRIEPA